MTLTLTFLYYDLHPEYSNPIYSQNAQAYGNISHVHIKLCLVVNRKMAKLINTKIQSQARLQYVRTNTCKVWFKGSAVQKLQRDILKGPSLWKFVFDGYVCLFCILSLFVLCFNMYLFFYVYCVLTICVSPWYNRTGWLGIKHQVTYITMFV